MSKNKIWVKLRDNGGSWTYGDYKFGGAENKPQHLEKTPVLVRALQYRLLVEVNEKDIKKTEKKEQSIEPDKEVAEITKETIKKALDKADYKELESLVKALNLFKGNGRVTKADAIDLLETYLEEKE